MTKILVIIDLQKGFLINNDNFKTKNNIVKILQSRYFDKVIATRYRNYDNSLFEKLLNYKDLKNESRIDLVSEIIPYIDVITDKTNYSNVNNGLLPLLIQANNGIYPTEIYIAGIDTDSCVLSTVIDLFNNNIIPKVLIDCCSSSGGEEYHLSALKILKRMIGQNQLINSTQLK